MATVEAKAPQADDDPREGERAGDEPAGHRLGLARRAAGVSAGAGAVLVALVAGAGWLYLLDGARLLGSGPLVSGSLPLEQLAHADAQPLLRVLVAWLPAGWLAGRWLARLTGVRRTEAALLVAVESVGVLYLAGAASDALVFNEPLGGHLVRGELRPGTLVAAAAMVMASALAARRRPRTATEGLAAPSAR